MLYLVIIKIKFSCPTLVMMANYRKIQDHSFESTYEIWKVASQSKSAAARFLGLLIWITPGAWMSPLVNVVCCQVEVFATGLSLVQS